MSTRSTSRTGMSHATAWRIFTLVVAALILTAVQLPARADTTYTFTAEAYNQCSGSYHSGGGLSCKQNFDLTVTFVLAGGPLAPNMTISEGALLTPEFHLGNLDTPVSDCPAGTPEYGGGGAWCPGLIRSYSFSDGSGLNISSADANAAATFNIATDSAGQITTWYMGACRDWFFCTDSLESYFFLGSGYAQVYEMGRTADGTGDCFASPVTSPSGDCGGSWSVSTARATPEPSSFLLLGTGLLGIGDLARRISLRSRQPGK